MTVGGPLPPSLPISPSKGQSLRGIAMNDLQKFFPNNQLQNLMEDLTTVSSWDDFARRFLLGEGKSPNTTAAYLEACRQFYDFTGGLHPMQAGTPAWIEQFYDSLTGSLNTKALRVAGLKYMYKKVGERFPFYTSPFDIMPETLKQKLSRTTKDESSREAFSEVEYKAILKMLRNDKTLKGYQNYAIFRFGVTSGMRAAELLALTWGNIAKTENGYSATFIGKGQKKRTIQLEVESVRAVKKAFIERWSRQPAPTDLVFHGLPTGRAGGSAGMTKAALHYRIKQIATAAVAGGILPANRNVSAHIMRHTCATRLLATGIDINTVKEHLGHSDISTTAQYLHNREDLSVAFEKMSA